MFARKKMKLLLGVLPFALVLALCAGCATSRPGTATAQPLGEGRPVDPRQDNAPALQQTVEGLVVQLKIEGERAEVSEVQVLRVPRAGKRRMGEGMIGVAALLDGREVYATAVPDEELNALEQGGLVRLADRTLTLTLPTGEPVTALEVRMGPQGSPQKLDLAPHLAKWCEQYQQQPQEWAVRWCRATSEKR
jgi:hypothetical protein